MLHDFDQKPDMLKLRDSATWPSSELIADAGVAWRREPVETALFYTLVAGLAWAPFWLGGNRLLPWGVDAILFPGLVIAYEASLLVRDRRHPVGLGAIAGPASLFAAVIVWIMIQMAPIGALAHPIWRLASDALGMKLTGSISVNVDLTTLALVRLLTEASAFYVSLQLCRDQARAEQLIKMIAAIGAGYALWGLIAFAIAPGRVLWFDNSTMKAALTSTFVNRNSYATYAGIGLVCTMALILHLYRRAVSATPGSPRHQIASFIETTGRSGIVLLGAAFVQLAALLATLSRGGVLSTFLGLVVLAVMIAGSRRHGARMKREIIFALVLLAGMGFLLFGDVFADRLSQQGVADDGRMAVYRIIIDMIANSPLTGYGYGAFADIFPMFRDQSISIIHYWDKAHSVYLELFVGLGVVFGAMLIAAIGWLVVKCLQGVAKRRRGETAPAVAVAVSVLVGVHALVDFSLQIQAVAITFAAILGAGVAQSESSRQSLAD